MRVPILIAACVMCLGMSAGRAMATHESLSANPTRPGSTVAGIRRAGRLRCGVIVDSEDWNKTDLHGPLAPLDLEICKAVAVAVLGATAQPEQLLESTTFPDELLAEEALAKGKVDLLVGVSPEATSFAHWNIAFGPAIFFDGQAVLVRADLAATSLKDLAGHVVCVIEGTDNEKILRARTIAAGIAVQPFDFQEEGEMDDAVATRHCDAVSAYASRLVELQRSYEKELGHDRMLADWMTLSPVTPAYRQGDAQWASIVDWTVYALIQAEASGVTQSNVSVRRSSEDIVVQRLLGIDWSASRALGLADKSWALNVIASVGNYGEIYERTIGSNSELRMPRGRNALWSNGGLMHPLPVQ